jgi:hypothetical protein
MINVDVRQLLTQTRFVFTQRIYSTPDGGHMLSEIQIEPLYESRIDLPAALGQNRLDGLCRPEDDPVFDAHDAPSPVRFVG